MVDSVFELIYLDGEYDTIKIIESYLEKMEVEKNVHTLFHYTSGEGLLGILNSKKLWSTDIRFLNDPGEIKLGLKKCMMIINKIQKEKIKNNYWSSQSSESKRMKRLYDNIKLRFDSIQKMLPIYCVSFCKNGDLLSQWKGYANYGSGYSIGFNKRFLERINGITDNSELFFLRKVIYDEKILEEMMRTLIDDFIEDQDILYWEDGISFYTVVIEFISYFFKSDFFEEEEEYRLIVYKKIDSGKNTIKHKVGQLMLIPYCEFGIDPIKKSIDKIITGPKLDYAKNIMSLQNFIKNGKIHHSTNQLG